MILASFESNALGKGTVFQNQGTGRWYAMMGAAGTVSEVHGYGWYLVVPFNLC